MHAAQALTAATLHAAGSKNKVALLAARYSANLPLHVEGDAQHTTQKERDYDAMLAMQAAKASEEV